MTLKKVTYYFVKSGELYIGITFLSFKPNATDDEILNLIIQKGINSSRNQTRTEGESISD